MTFKTSAKKYKTEYAKIMRKPQADVGEVHHIVPRSVAKLRGWDDGRLNQKKNLRKLSYQDHYRAHILLCYFLRGEERDKMIYAWNWMSNRKCGFINEAEYTHLRSEHSRVVSEKMSGKVNCRDRETGETKQVTKEEFDTDDLLVSILKGKVNCRDKETGETKCVTKEEFDRDNSLVGPNEGKVVCRDNAGKIKRVTKEKFDRDPLLVSINKGKKASQETKAKMSKSRRGKTHSQEAKDKMSKAKQGKTHTQESKNKMSKYAQNRPQEHKDKIGRPGTVNCRDLRTGERRRVTKEEFDRDSLLVGSNSKKPNIKENNGI